MTSAPPAPSSQPATQPPAAGPFHGTPRWRHNAHIVLAGASAAALLLPPRRLDLRAAALSGTLFFMTSELTRDYTGRSLNERLSERFVSRRPQHQRQQQQPPPADSSEPGKEGSLGQRLWRGSEPDDWMEKRLRKEREALEDGRGYWGLITEQVWEVWNQGKSNGGEAQGAKAEEETKNEEGEKKSGSK